MKKSFKIGAALLASLALAPVAVPSFVGTSRFVQAISQTESQRLLSLGASLSAEQQQQTAQLLGATDVSAANTVYVDGTVINRFLQDGSGPGTVVYSSAFIESQSEGYGVQVQIVTPQNITLVTPATYQNAAITAGAKNVLVKIGTVSPVTGEGALAGVYALLEQSGVQLNQQSIQVAEKEIQIIQQVQEETDLTDDQANQISSDIKQQIIIETTENSGDTLTEEQIIQIVQNTINNTVNNVDNSTTVDNSTNVDNSTTVNNTEINVSPEVIEEISNWAAEFATTDQAQDADVVEQLQNTQANTAGQSWSQLLSSQEGAVPAADLLAAERPDFSDEAVYHPAIQAFYNNFYGLVEAGETVDTLYSHTFVFEALTPNLSATELDALNQLRVLIYQYAANSEADREAAATTAGIEYITLKDHWLNQLNSAESLRAQNPVLAEIIQRIANATGLAPEVFSYAEMTQSEELINFFIRWDAVSHMTMMADVEFSLADDSMVQYDEVLGTATNLPDTFDFASVYGVQVENQYVQQEIPADFTIPGYVAEEVSSEETEETTEESTEEVIESEGSEEEASQQESVIEETNPEEPVEETVPEDGTTEGTGEEGAE